MFTNLACNELSRLNIRYRSEASASKYSYYDCQHHRERSCQCIKLYLSYGFNARLVHCTFCECLHDQTKMDQYIKTLRQIYKFDNRLFDNWLGLVAQRTGYSFNSAARGVTITEYTAVVVHLDRNNLSIPADIMECLIRAISYREEVTPM